MKKILIIASILLLFSNSIFAQDSVGLDNEEDLKVDPLFSLDMPDDGVSELEKTEVPETEAYDDGSSEAASSTEEASSTSVTTSSSDSSSSESSSDDDDDDEDDDDTKKVKASKGGISEVPAAKRPKPIDNEKASAAAEKDENEKSYEEHKNTIKYGIPSEISELVDELIKNDDPRFSDDLYDVFQLSKNNTIKEKIIQYFTKQEDPCLEDFAVNLLNDPYDEAAEIVKACFKYISAVKTKAAIPAVISLIESENEAYFNDAIAALGEIGGAGEAVFLMEYLNRDDLSDAQRQILMRTSGKMHAVETWDYLVDVLQDEDENTFVRMYAAESLGLMKKKESVPVLVEAFNSTDPNLRQYVIKGLLNFTDVVEAKETVIQGIRDEHWRVRQEAIKAVKEMKLEDATPFLIYRAKNDSEKVIKDESIKSLAQLNTKEGNEFLISQITDKKVGDSTKKKVVEVLLVEGKVGESEILDLANTCLEDDRRKDLRHAIGKELSKYKRPQYENICLKYLQSKDSTTIGLGLDMYKTNKFASAESIMRDIYADKKNNSGVRARIKKMLEIEDEEKKDGLK
ncbi:MAG: HEAT repeat domain-containing protein [Treponema sp.]|nr:HEAT repeat domain-containing protein [Treponema sp.]